MTLDVAIHKNILVRILKDIFTDPQIAPYLGFNGGTAAMLFYNLSRFSVDLYFDLLDATKEDIVFEKVESILKN
jgi:predicted nucleotidyltransferase component of viral defense system